MANTLIREKISYNSNPFSPVPTYWNGTSYEKVQGVNGAARIVIYDSAGETFTDANPASVAIISSAGGTIVLSSTSPGIIEVISSAGGTALMSNSNPANTQVISSAGGTVVLNNNSPGFIEIVSSSGGTAYFSNTNQGYLTHKYSENEANAWSANATISSGATSRVINAIYNEKVNYFGTITNTATITLSMQVSQNNFNWYTAENRTITAGTSSPFFYTFTTSARYLRLLSSGVSATVTASIMGKYKWYTNIVTNGNFANGTTGLVSIASTLSTANNILSVTGDGTQNNPRFLQATTILNPSLKKFYISGKFRVTNSNSTSIDVGLFSSSILVNANSQLNPIQNQWYKITGIVTTTSGMTSTAQIRCVHSYVDAATANGKIMEVKEVLAIDLTWYFGAGNEPNVDTCNKIFPFIE